MPINLHLNIRAQAVCMDMMSVSITVAYPSSETNAPVNSIRGNVRVKKDVDVPLPVVPMPLEAFC